jgi:hypothetical protein
MYPKIWSVYVANDGSDRGDYKAYLHPVSVPSTTNKNSRFALRLEIINKNMDTVLNDYQSRLKKGEDKLYNHPCRCRHLLHTHSKFLDT